MFVRLRAAEFGQHGLRGWEVISRNKVAASSRVGIPSRSNATKKANCSRRFYRQRHKIENFFCRAEGRRRIATRYDKLARNFLAATLMIGTLYWIRL